MNASRRVLITGATRGIGRATALMFAERGFACVVHGRTAAAAAAVAAEIRSQVGGVEPEWVAGDLADYSAVMALGRELCERRRPLDIVVHNAAVWAPRQARSHDGLELSIAVNFVAPFALSNALRECLSGTQTAPRIVNVAALVHSSDYAPLAETCELGRSYQAWDAYARSKQYLIMMTYALPRRFSPQPIEAVAVHPGVIDTEMLRATGSSFGAPVEEGASALYMAATAPLKEGAVFFAHGRATLPASVCRRAELQDELWRDAEQLCAQLSSRRSAAGAVVDRSQGP